MKTDIEIAQETKMLPITTVASQYGITEDDLELTESTRQRSPMSSGRRSKTDRTENSFW